jgi:WD40 repeat protein
MKKLIGLLAFLLLENIFFLHARASTVPSLSITASTYSRAQVVCWLNENRFAVGRWDGTVSIFRPPLKGEYGPTLTEVLMLPSGKPAEMLLPIGKDAFVSSNDPSSLVFWTQTNGHEQVCQTATYDPQYGEANSAVIATNAGATFLVTGHSEGWILIWEVSDTLHFLRAVSVRSKNPIPSPYQLWNVRGLVAWRDSTVVSGAEDGDICLIKIPGGEVIARARYNPSAERGINSLSMDGDLLALGNCSVGKDDKNLWFYRVASDGPHLINSMNLVSDTAKAQVFDFNVQLLSVSNTPYFLASTGEGILWLGTLSQNSLVVLDNKRVSPDGAAALAYEPTNSVLTAIAYDIENFLLLGNGILKAKP